MNNALKTQRMRNYAEQRITEYKRTLDAILAKDPKVQEYKQKQQQQQEVTQEVINNVNRDTVKNRKKKRTVAILPSLDNQETEEMPTHSLLTQQKSYKLVKPANGQIKNAMRMSFFDKAFQRDCM
jgi:lipase chaperone LimK